MISIETELKKEGIEVIRLLDTLTINSIAKNVANKLVTAFPEQNLNAQDLFIKLCRLHMYIAKLPNDLSKAKYYYRNNSIYFSEEIDLSNIDVCVVHECLHYLQELRDEKNNLVQLGLCNFTTSRLPGMALNEASVQLMSSKAIALKSDIVKYFDITFPTYSPSHYALECNLIQQMAYITGDYTLYNSTLYSNDNFFNKFISLTNKHAFFTIQDNMDTLMNLEEKLSIETAKLENIEDTEHTISKITKRIETLKLKIQHLFLETQNIIITSYFNASFKTISSLEQIESYRKNLYSFKDLIGTTDTYTYFNDYYIKQMVALEEKRNLIEHSLSVADNNLSLIPVKHNMFIDLFRKLRKVFQKNVGYEQVEEKIKS